MENDPKEISALVRLLSLRGISRRRVRALVAEAISGGASYEAAVGGFLDAASSTRPEVVQLCEALRKSALPQPLPTDIWVVNFSEPVFPALLRAIPDPPLALFIRGDGATLGAAGVAVVGSRRCTPQGRRWAQTLAEQLAAAGIIVVSGLAYGIDAAAHRGALDAGGRTLAVLGSGVDHVYPARHRGLAAEILQRGGALVSEYPPGVAPRPEHFPERNRIVSGLASGVVVAEASDKSGSLITARLALEQGREVMAVPGSVAAATARGCHRLLKQGAALVEDVTDVLETLGWAAPERAVADPAASLGAREREVFGVIGAAVTTCDQIVVGTGLETQAVLETLTILQVEGFVEACHGGYIRRPF
jgi:DNA processing protein